MALTLCREGWALQGWKGNPGLPVCTLVREAQPHVAPQGHKPSSA